MNSMDMLTYSTLDLGLTTSMNMKTPYSYEVEVISIDEIPNRKGFLNLPREIRDEIYGLFFLSDEKIVYPSRSRARSISEAINLLRANKQVYSEAVDILYGQNMFQIRGDPAFMAPELLNLLIFQRRKDTLRQQTSSLHTPCKARHFLKRLSIPSHGISLDRLKHLFSLLQYFQNWSTSKSFTSEHEM